MIRRALLTGTGAAVVALVGGGVWRASSQGVFNVGQGPAYEPWRTWRSDGTTGSVELVRAAILAANPHNSQPWLFRISPTRIDLFADTDRNIGAIDPLRREMYVGLGCALENLLLAANAEGYVDDLTLMPDPANPTHVARVDLALGSARIASELYEAIPKRHTNRAAYDTRRLVGADTRAALEQLTRRDDTRVIWFVSDSDRRRVGELIVKASEAIVADEGQSQSSAAWLRFDAQEVQRHRDGITIDTNVTPSYMRVIAKMLPPVSRERGDQFWLAATRDQVVPTAAGFGILAVADPHDRAQRLRGGRVWQRMQLWATGHGLCLHPQSQLTERSDRERTTGARPTFTQNLRELVGDRRWQALMLFRFGYPTEEAALSPRRPVEAVIL